MTILSLNRGRLLLSAPALSNSWTAFKQPRKAAACSAVFPSRAAAFTSALTSSNTFTTLRPPRAFGKSERPKPGPLTLTAQAARCKGLTPSALATSLSPSWSKSCTASTCPNHAAPCNAFNPCKVSVSKTAFWSAPAAQRNLTTSEWRHSLM